MSPAEVFGNVPALSGKTRVALLVEKSETFLLPALDRTIEALNARGFPVTHLGVVPRILSRYQGWEIPLWYSRVFGFWNTGLLALFSTVEGLRRLQALLGASKMSISWVGLAQKFGLKLRFLRDPNSPEALEFLRSGNCDILFILVPYVLREPILAVPRMGVINKHAALLPGCRGLFPYVWSIIRGLPLGMTFHEVVPKIDAGPALVRKPVPEDRIPRSMAEFYIWVFRQFPGMAVEAAEQCMANAAVESQESGMDAYFSLPTRSDYKQFRRAGGRVVRFGDLFRSLAL